MEDKELIELFSNLSNYLKLQYELNKLINNGIFLLIKSKKNNLLTYSNNNNTIINCRENITSSYTLKLNNNNEYIEINNKLNINPLLLICGLPSPDLKNSQIYFQKSLSIIIKLTTIINQINEKLNKKLLNEYEIIELSNINQIENDNDDENDNEKDENDGKNENEKDDDKNEDVKVGNE